MAKVLLNLIILFVGIGEICAENARISYEKINLLEKKIEHTKNKIASLRVTQLRYKKDLQSIKNKNNPLLNQKQVINKNDLHSLTDVVFDRYNPTDNTFKFSTPDEENTLSFHLLLSVDNDTFFNYKGLTINTGTRGVPVNEKNTVTRFWVANIRPSAAVTLRKYFSFYINPDFGQNQNRLYDGYFSVNYWRILGMRLGKQISLVSGVENYSMFGIMHTMQPGLTTILAPNREFGLMLFGSLGPYRVRSLNLGLIPFGFDDWLAYQVGFFSGTPDGTNPGLNPISARVFDSQRSTLANKAFEGRVILNPFINYQNSVLEPLAFGIGGSSQIVNNEALLPGLLSPGLNPMFLYQNVVDECGVVQFLNGFCPSVHGNGPRTRIHPSIFWHYKKFGLIFEAGNTLQTLTPLEKTKLNETVLPHLKQINQAAQMQFVYNLTSEKYRYLGMIPEQDFKFFEKGATGAWQIIFQIGVLKIDPNTFNDFYTVNNQKIFWYSDPRISIQHAQSFTFTLNWYWNKYFRISTEYDQTQYRGGCSTGGLNSPVTPGCLTAPAKFIRAENSEVLNRPTEKLIMQRFVLAF